LSLAAAIRRLVDSASVRVERPAVYAGLDVFEAVDRRAIELLAATGAETRLLSAE
jgi:hypothetical protein